ncbi:hypothetical protein ACIQVE_07485 [Pseudomonas sp. NPDC098747]|uniref:hypothetical protein n=1 Tax=Pseudomonas sp. NPDC098747 TaxID=3364487 RepID=UPI00383AC84A
MQLLKQQHLKFASYLVQRVFPNGLIAIERRTLGVGKLMQLIRRPTLVSVKHQHRVTQAYRVVPVSDRLRSRCGRAAVDRGVGVEVDAGECLFDVWQADVQQIIKHPFQHRCERRQPLQLVKHGLRVQLLTGENIGLLGIEDVAFDHLIRQGALGLLTNLSALGERKKCQ